MNNYSILVVDDELFIRKILSEILLHEGYEVHLSESGEDALEFLAENSVDFILLDIKLPGIDGIEVLRSIRDLLSKTIVVMISGHGNYEDAVESVKLGAFDFIEKPFSIPELLSTLEKVKKRKIILSAYDTYSMNETLGYFSIFEVEKAIKNISRNDNNVIIYGKPGGGKKFIVKRLHSMCIDKYPFFKSFNCRVSEERKKLFKYCEKGGSLKEFVMIEYIDLLDKEYLSKLGNIKGKIVATTDNEGFSSEKKLFPTTLILPGVKQLSKIDEMFYFSLESNCRRFGKIINYIDTEVMKIIKNYDWPENFREFEEVSLKLAQNCQNGLILATDLKNIIYTDKCVSFSEYMEKFRNNYIINIIESTDWDFKLASERLGISMEEISEFLCTYKQKLQESTGTYVLELDSEYSEIQKAQNFVDEIAIKNGVGENKRFELRLLVDELLANAIEHGYRDRKGKIWFSLTIRNNSYEMIASDSGKGFYFKKSELPKDIYSGSGRGLYIIEKLGDELDISSKVGKGTDIRIKSELKDLKVIVVGENLRLAAFRDEKNIEIEFFNKIEELSDDLEKEGLILMDESLVMENSILIRNIKSKYPMYKIIICGDKSKIRKSAEFILHGADDFWNYSLITPKFKVFIQNYFSSSKKLINFEKKYDFITTDKDILNFKLQMLKFEKKGNIIVLNGESGVGKSHFCKYLAKLKGLEYINIDFKKHPEQITKLLKEQNRFIEIDSCADNHIRIQRKIADILKKEILENNTLVFSHNPEEDEPVILEYLNVPYLNFKFPSLKKRKNDISLMFHFFLKTEAFDRKEMLKILDEDALIFIQNYDWPKNIKEIKAVVEKCYEKISERIITRKKLKKLIEYKASDPRISLEDAMNLAEKKYINMCFKKYGNNAYKFIGLKQKKWKEKLRKYSII